METNNVMDERMLLLFDAAPICCKLWRKNMDVVLCNQECVRAFGTDSKEEFCQRFFSFSPEYQPNGTLSSEAAVTEIAKGFAEGFNKFSWMHQKKDGTPMPCELTLVKVSYKGEDALAGYIRDVTEQQQMQKVLEAATAEAQSANIAKTAFLANMSHEMRTPLNVIIGLTDLLIEEMSTASSDIYENIRKVNSAGNTLLSIVNDVLDISKIEAGKLDLTPVTYSTASLLNDVITLNKIRIESKPINFIVDISPDVPHNLFGDDLRLTQIFNNLLSNAFKYTHEGSVFLTISCQNQDGDVWLNITVSDTGIGIKPEDLPDLFAEYNQVDMMANRKIEGTGLGLPITKKLIELMDGNIRVESEYGKGSSFILNLKQGYVDDSTLGSDIVTSLKSFSFSENKQHVSAKLVRDDMSYARVLVVDDFQTNLDVATGMLKKYKMQVDCVTSGQAAIERIRAATPIYDAVFMDHMMPEMDGIEATERIRQLDSEYARNIPIISLTANAISGNEKMFLDSGFQAFLSKPIDILKLDAILKQWVRDKARGISGGLDSREPVTAPSAPGLFEDAAIDSIQIPGIDFAKGMALYGDDMELYGTIIESYARNTPEVISKLRNVTEETLAEYAINVHGLKGSSGNIGAESLRELAARMEKAAKAGNLDEVLEQNDSMLLKAEELISNIEKWTQMPGSGGSKPVRATIDNALLDRLCGCCENFDMNGADDAMSQLLEFSYEQNNGLIEWLSEKVATSEFDEIVERIKEYRGESK